MCVHVPTYALMHISYGIILICQRSGTLNFAVTDLGYALVLLSMKLTKPVLLAKTLAKCYVLAT